jgi:uncharacterized protein YaiL (DUF2058 family)
MLSSVSCRCGFAGKEVGTSVNKSGQKTIERAENFVVGLGQPAKTDRDKNDPYADYQVTGDLIW